MYFFLAFLNLFCYLAAGVDFVVYLYALQCQCHNKCFLFFFLFYLFRNCFCWCFCTYLNSARKARVAVDDRGFFHPLNLNCTMSLLYIYFSFLFLPSFVFDFIFNRMATERAFTVTTSFIHEKATWSKY